MLLLVTMSISIQNVKTGLAVHLPIHPFGPPSTIIITRNTRFAEKRRPDCHAYTYIISVRVTHFCGLIDANILEGSFIGFAGSAFSDHVHYEPLTPVIPLWYSLHDTDMLDTVVRMLGAFKNAASRLQTYYTKLQAQSPADQSPTDFTTAEEMRWPYPTTFTHLKTGIATSLKLKHLTMPEKLLYIGSIQEGKDVIVKFVRSYSKDLHEHCVSLGFAPTLFGYKKLDGGWYMVVMEFMRDYMPFSSVVRASMSSQLQPMVMGLVSSFHAKGFVHGDMRDANILVHKVNNGTLEMKLVDFDWGGEAGKVHYPYSINDVTVSRPPGVSGGRLIMMAHDVEMVDIMFRGLA